MQITPNPIIDKPAPKRIASRAERKEKEAIATTLGKLTKAFFDTMQKGSLSPDSEELAERYNELERYWKNYCHKKFKFHEPKLEGFASIIEAEIKAMQAQSKAKQVEK